MGVTIKRGTTLEEGTLLPESLQFECAPWTSFYTAGGIIRELRKASGKQSKYGSEGNRAPSNEVIDHDNHPCDVDRLPKGNPNGGTGLLGAFECGDVLKLQMKINSGTQFIDEAEFQTTGCSSAIASSSLTNEWVKGKTSRKHWPSRTRISSARSAFPRATLLDATKYSRIGGRLHLVGSLIFLTDHPLRTLLHELCVEPSLRLLQRPFGRKVKALPTKNDVGTPE
jgi:NifU-like protein